MKCQENILYNNTNIYKVCYIVNCMHKGVNKKRCIRKIASSKTGDVYGMTIPKYIKEKFEDTYFEVLVSGNSVILESGCKNG